jgi:hypothetical protein
MVIVTFDDLRSDRLLALSIQIINELSELNNRKKNCNNLMVW